MKKIAMLLVLFALPFLATAQSEFDKFEEMDGVEFVKVTEKAIQMFTRIDADDPDAKQLMEMIKGIKGVRIFSTENADIAKDMKVTVSKYLKAGKMEELIRVKDKEANIKFYIKEGKDSDHVKELLMYVDGLGNIDIKGRKIESVILTIVGDIDLNKINELTKQMHLPEELGKAQKK